MNFFVHFLSADMMNLKLTEQKTLMAKARARRGDKFASKSVLSVIQTPTFKRKKTDVGEATPFVSDPHTTYAPSFGGSKLSSPKRIKTLMNDLVCPVDLVVITLKQDSRGSHQSNLSTEFEFRSNSFNGMNFLYDHLNSTEDVKKVKRICAQHLTQNIRAYLIRCVVITR